ncbi:MAG: hypothetical protein ABS35_37090 [Kaistia sp. SCN 65-12]|nr:MAG: hypothetical protein ABS35_37090 [Kaistia sp. SCN 65-12]
MDTTDSASDDLASLLQAAFAGGYVATTSKRTFTVSEPIVIDVANSFQGPVGVDLGGAAIISNVTGDAPVIQINAAPGVDLANLTLSDFSIYGNGSEESGIRIVADGADRHIHDWSVRDVTVQHVGGAGLDVVGHVTKGTVFNAWMHGNAGGGARFANGANGGVVSDIEWSGGGFRRNDVGGLVLDEGAQDVSVNGAYFVENLGPGIAAPSGIARVTSSGFENNEGAAITFNGHGDFWANTFSTHGPQTVGISGVLSGKASILGSDSEYYGPGEDNTLLADVQGTGTLSLSGGKVVTGEGVVVNESTDLSDQVVVSRLNVAMPSLTPVTSETTAPVADSNGHGALEVALRAALTEGYLAHLPADTFVVTSPIVINIDSSSPSPKGIDLGGATIVSQITDGSPVIQINVGPGVDLRYLTLSNFTLQGNGQEGDGIKIVADGNDRWLYNWTVSDVNIRDVGGIGLDVIGSVFEGMVSNTWVTGNAEGGARFAHSPSAGLASALRWYDGGAQDNGVAGIILDNGTRDLSVDGAAFSENHGPGIAAPYGITSVADSRFEDNQGAGVSFQNYGSFIGNSFVTSGAQTYGVEAWLQGQAILVDNASSYTGPGANPTALANLQGLGVVGLSGDGKVIAGPTLEVKGFEGLTTSQPPAEHTLPVLQEGVGVDPALINGIVDEAFLTGDGSIQFSVEMETAISGYRNTLGAYEVAADGTISNVHILFANTLATSAGVTVDLGVPAANQKIGFFLVQDGFGLYGNLPSDLSFVAPGTGMPADLDTGLPPALHSASRGPLSAPIFHSFSTLNPGDVHQVLSGVASGGRELLIGFEDLARPTGDNDFQDVVIRVTTNTDGLLAA